MSAEGPARVTITTETLTAAESLKRFVEETSVECRVGIETPDELVDKEPIPPVSAGGER